MPLASDTPSTVNEVSWVCRAFIRAIPSVFHAFFGHRLSSIATIEQFDGNGLRKVAVNAPPHGAAGSMLHLRLPDGSLDISCYVYALSPAMQSR